MIDRLSAALEGRYRIERELGEGGMATVYLAEDLKHKRQVALKVLKPELAAVVGAERFLGEIEVTAHLQHPNILPLFDSGEADGFLYYVMPYVEGESLRERLDREHQLPVEEVQRLATEVAEALDHAHRQGVVHRDIKPANILLRDNRPLVADFGIALAVGAAGGTRLTETGLSVGTPYYMSPEQATGDQQVGAQTDIYALGCVTYEMLVGDPPYTGSTAQAVLGKIIQGGRVSATTARDTVPANIDATIQKALEKLPADRFDTAQHFADALNDPGFRHGVVAAVDEAAIAGWRRRARIYGTAAAVLGVLVAWGLFRPEPEPDRAVTRVSVRMPEGQELAGNGTFALSRDGSFMIYEGPADDGSSRLWLRRWNALTASPIQDTEGALAPSISPDGEEVAFYVGGAIRVVPIRGGVTRTLVQSARCCPGWSADSRWVYYPSAETGGISRVPASGGPAEVVTVLDSASGRTAHVRTETLPDPGYILMKFDRGEADSITVIDIAAGAVRPILRGDFPRYSPSGHILYAVPGTLQPQLMAVPFDLKTMAITGTPTPITEHLVPSFGGWHYFALSDNGRLLYRGARGADALANRWTPVWIDRRGAVQVVDPSWEFNPGNNNRGIAISPDGERVAVNVMDAAGQEDIWIKQLPRGPFSRLTTDTAEDVRPKWSRDGRSIVYISRRGNDEGANSEADVWIRRADGIGEPSPLLDLPVNIWEAEVSPDGRYLLARVGGQANVAGERDIVVMGPDDSTAVPVLDAGYDEKAIALSRDGRWLAYESDETGRNEIYVRPFPDMRAGKFPVSQNGGVMPVWANTRNELYFVNGSDELVAASYEPGPAFRVVQLSPLFDLPPNLLFRRNEFYSLYDVTPDDQRFIWYQSTVDQADQELILVDNWADEIRGPGG